MKFFISLLTYLAFMPLAVFADEGEAALLCADQSDNRIRLINPSAKEPNKFTLWCYPAEDGKKFRYMPTDAKLVKLGGVQHILAAYHGRVQLIRFKDQKLIKDYPSLSSCHSAELLPDGKIVSANSNHGKLRLHHSADQFTDTDLPYAHGVMWDAKRNYLWVLGDFLYRFHYKNGGLKIDRKFKLPVTPTGHDLFPLRNGKKLLVSNNDALFLFDIATEKFETISTLKEIKSASQHPDGTIWATDPTNIEGGASWQSNAVICIKPATPAKHIRAKGARFYKARWWQ
ncbi:MAG: DUF6528 family protein [Akkermansiaceae bacterium]